MAKKILANIIFSMGWAISLIPLRLLYVLSDIAFIATYLCPPIRYRKRIVRKNLKASFPDYSTKELRRIEMKFYHNFFDVIMESLKICSVSPRWISRHITFPGADRLINDMQNGRSVIAYMGHTGNWEWVSSFALVIPPYHICCEVYHPLENSVMDMVIKKVRERFGSVTIPMDLTFRRLVEYKNMNQPVIIGMISDQVPLWENMHFWTEFLNQKTSIFTGAERIARKLDMATYYAEVVRVKRGRYECRLISMFDDTSSTTDYQITERYARMLEKTIQNDPSSWLWSHNRWKRTWEQYLENRQLFEKKRGQTESDEQKDSTTA